MILVQPPFDRIKIVACSFSVNNKTGSFKGLPAPPVGRWRCLHPGRIDGGRSCLSSPSVPRLSASTLVPANMLPSCSTPKHSGHGSPGSGFSRRWCLCSCKPPRLSSRRSPDRSSPSLPATSLGRCMERSTA